MGFSAAGLQSLINEAALLAARQHALCVGPEHFAEGIERVVRLTKGGATTPNRHACHSSRLRPPNRPIRADAG